MDKESKEVFDMYFAAAMQGLLANEQCCPYSYGFDAERVATKAYVIARDMLKKREQIL